MNKLSRLMLWLLPLLTVLILGTAFGPKAGQRYTSAPDTVVYIVRHAEKDLTPNLPDPALTPVGQARALALRKRLASRPRIRGVFSTNTGRTRATAQPLAERYGLPIENYDAKQLPALAERIKRDFRGQAVLIVGHSNTILETVEAFGAARPVASIGDDAYDYLLKVTIPGSAAGPATAVAEHYGAKH